MLLIPIDVGDLPISLRDAVVADQIASWVYDPHLCLRSCHNMLLHKNAANDPVGIHIDFKKYLLLLKGDIQNISFDVPKGEDTFFFIDGKRWYLILVVMEVLFISYHVPEISEHFYGAVPRTCH